MEKDKKQSVAQYQDYLIRIDNDQDISFEGKVIAEVKGLEFSESYGQEVVTILTIYQTKPNKENASVNFVFQKCQKYMADNNWQPENGPSSRSPEHHEKHASFLGDTIFCSEGRSMVESFTDFKNSMRLFKFFGYNNLAKELYIKAGINCVNKL
ncbi:MAG: hypothetical protein J6N72_07205 [Psychrobacter sp.]|nr:hypothetical protein [Psychrobacter sp.]